MTRRPEPRSPVARYAFGYTDEKPSRWWIVLTVAGLVFVIAAAFSPTWAQTADAGSQSSSNTQVGTQAIAIAGGGLDGGGRGTPRTQRIENTPDAYAPPIAGGNPCVVGASAGVTFPGVGLSGGGMWQDEECELRQQAALLTNMGLRHAAVALLCANDRNLHRALVLAGECRTASPAAYATEQCYLKPGTRRTVVSSAPDRAGREACARHLGVM